MIPIKLTMENFISHMHSEIDFTQFNVALVVGASNNNTKIANGVGKTSIFDAIRFALYGKVRFSKKEKVIKRGKASCKVTFMFSTDNDIYKVERSMSKKTGLIDVNFYKRENREWIHEGYTCDTPTATTTKIESIIKMSHDTFVSCIYFRQNDISGFAGAKPSKRKEILKEVLQIGFWDELQETAKKYEKDLIDRRKVVIDRLESLENIEKQHEEIKNELAIIISKLNQAKDDIIKREISLKENDKKISKLEKILSKEENGLSRRDLEKKLNDISIKAEGVKSKRDAIKREVQKNNEEIVNAQNDCKFLDEKLLNLSKTVLAVEHPNRDKAESIFRALCNEVVPTPMVTPTDLKNKKDEYNKYNRNLDLLHSQYTELTSLKPGEECPICLAKISNPTDVAKRRETKQKFLQNQLTELEQKIAEINKSIQKEEDLLSEANNAIVEIERLELVIAKRLAVKSSATERNNQLREKFNILANEWNILKEERERVGSILNALVNVDSCQQELNDALERKDKLSENLLKLREEVVDFSVKQGHFEANLEEIERKMSEKQTLSTQKAHLTTDIEVYSEVSKAFGKDGIQAIVMENVTEDLRKYTNSILKCICSEPMSIDFVTQRQTGTGTWKEDFNILIMIGNDEMDFDDLSGGEQVRVSIALRLALSKLLMQRIGSNIKFLLLDEVDQTLDGQGVDVLADAISTLSREFKIMLISHNEAMKEKFEHVITVFKGSGGSVIR